MTDDDYELLGRRLRRKGALRVLAAGALSLLVATLIWINSADTPRQTMARRRLFALGAGLVGISLLIGGAIMLARANRPNDPDA